MAVRILHCGKSTENYNLCVEYKVAGFSKRVADKGDLVYLAVKYDGNTVCGARGILSEVTIDKPWPDSDRYIQAYRMVDVEFCNPFELSILSKAGGQYWVLKYAQNAKEIKDQEAIELLECSFNNNRQDTFSALSLSGATTDTPGADEETDYDNMSDDQKTSTDQEAIHIMGTFETVRFVNETDPYMGLEKSVNNYFFELFPHFPQERTLLIKDNKLFKTSGLESGNNKGTTGIQGVPDGLIVNFSKDEKVPFKIVLIEYECYGEGKIKTIDKFNYLNGHIIPQLMRFASTFSIVTDRQIREMTIKRWIEKIIEHIWENDPLSEKVKGWIKELDPNIKLEQIALKLSNLLEASFKSNLGIMLVIDELTYEQRDTIKNIIGSFKLEDGNSVTFYGFVVRLEQKLCIIDEKLEYALSVQQYY